MMKAWWGRSRDFFGNLCEFMDVNVGHIGNFSTLVSLLPLKVYLSKHGMDHNYGWFLIEIAKLTNPNG